MRQTTFTELRNNAKTYFDAVEAGETVRVLRNGRPIADIVPVPPETPSWKRRSAKPIVVKGIRLSEEIMRDRKNAAA